MLQTRQLEIDCRTFDEAQHALDACAGGGPPCPAYVLARLYALPSGGVLTVHCEAVLRPQQSRVYIAEKRPDETYRPYLPPLPGLLLKKYPDLPPHQLLRISTVQRELGVLLRLPGSSDPAYVRTAAFLQRLTDWLAVMYRLDEVSAPYIFDSWQNSVVMRDLFAPAATRPCTCDPALTGRIANCRARIEG